jgi:hypothetical protein
MEEGQKMGKLFQKFVAVLMEDWACGGLGRIGAVLSSGSIGSRTAVQNLTRSWMTGLCLALGVGSLRSAGLSSPEAKVIQEVLHQSHNLSASALTELRRRCAVCSLLP